MRIAFVALLILGLLAAPVYLLPRLLRTDTGEGLFTRAARQIVSDLPDIPEMKTVSVAPIKEDFHQEFQFALADELRRQGRIQVVDDDLFRKRRVSIREVVHTFRDVPPEIEEQNLPDTILSGRIHRNEKVGRSHLMQIHIVLVDAVSGKLLWSGGWRGSQRVSDAEWKLDKTVLLICLAFAAGILVIFARREDQRQLPTFE